MTNNILTLDFDDIWKMTNKLASKIQKTNYHIESIIAIARGGLVIARLLSDILGISNVVTIGVSYYQGINETKTKPVLTQDVNYDLRNKKVIVIDDVSDTGKSMHFVISHLKENGFKNVKTATLHYKPQSIFRPDFFIAETTKWIVYPWERVEFSKQYFQKGISDGRKLAEIKNSLEKINIPDNIIEFILKNKNKEK